MLVKIRGKEYGFAATLGAIFELKKLCPDGNINRLGEYVGNEDYETAIRHQMEMIRIFNDWYVKKEQFEGREAAQIDTSIFEMLEIEEYREVWAAVLKTYANDGKPTIETKETGSKNADAGEES